MHHPSTLLFSWRINCSRVSVNDQLQAEWNFENNDVRLNARKFIFLCRRDLLWPCPHYEGVK